MQLPRRLSEAGPVIEYLNGLLSSDGEVKRQQAKDAIRDLRSLLSTPQGSMLLDLLEKATLERVVPLMTDPRALAALNAQSFIALDLRRILSDEFDAVLADQKPGVGRSKRGRKRGEPSG